MAPRAVSGDFGRTLLELCTIAPGARAPATRRDVGMTHASSLLLLAIAGLVGCNAPARVPTMTPDEIAHEVNVERVPSRRVVSFLGQPLGTDELGGGVATQFYLRSFLHTDTGQREHQLFVARRYQASRAVEYVRATDDERSTHPVTGLGRDFGSCSQSLGACIYTERLTVSLDEDFLRAKRDTGFRMTLSSEGGWGVFDVEVPANYVRGQLIAVEAADKEP